MLSSIKHFFFLVAASFILFSCTNSSKFINETASVPLFNVTGKVTEQKTGQPVSGVKIWVEGTTINANTGTKGTFSLKIPEGHYKVLAQHTGYAKDVNALKLERDTDTVRDFNFTIKQKPGKGTYISRSIENTFEPDSGFESVKIELLLQKIDSLEEVITGLETKLYGKDPQIMATLTQEFVQQYINKGDLNCTLINYEEVTFSEREEGVLWINNPIILTVMNYELGYEIKVHLEEYISKKYSEILGVTVDADYYFKELEPENPDQQKLWEKSREHYFEGSLRHFLIAMASDKSPLYFGYRIFSGQFVSNTSAMAYSSSDVSDIEVEKYEVFFPDVLKGYMILSLDGELRVEYLEKRVNDPHNIMGLGMYQDQTSWLSLNTPSIEYSKNGIVKNPENVEVKGVWRYTPVCQMLPSNYLPAK